MNEGPLNIRVDVWGLHWFIFIICLLKYHKNKWMLWVPLWGQRGQCEERSHSSWVCTSCLPSNHFSSPDLCIFSSCHINWSIKFSFFRKSMKLHNHTDTRPDDFLQTQILYHPPSSACVKEGKCQEKAVHVLVHHVDTPIHSW